MVSLCCASVSHPVGGLKQESKIMPSWWTLGDTGRHSQVNSKPNSGSAALVAIDFVILRLAFSVKSMMASACKHRSA